MWLGRVDDPWRLNLLGQELCFSNRRAGWVQRRASGFRRWGFSPLRSSLLGHAPLWTRRLPRWRRLDLLRRLDKIKLATWYRPCRRQTTHLGIGSWVGHGRRALRRRCDLDRLFALDRLAKHEKNSIAFAKNLIYYSSFRLVELASFPSTWP